MTRTWFWIALFMLAGGLSACGPAARREIRQLRPEGSGATGYGIATQCVPGTCLQAQQQYHDAILAIRRKYGLGQTVSGGALFSRAMALAEAVDRAQLTPRQADDLLQQLRLQIEADQAAQNATEEALRLQRIEMIQRSLPTPTPPVNCLSYRVGAILQTTCQ